MPGRKKEVLYLVAASIATLWSNIRPLVTKNTTHFFQLIFHKQLDWQLPVQRKKNMFSALFSLAAQMCTSSLTRDAVKKKHSLELHSARAVWPQPPARREKRCVEQCCPSWWPRRWRHLAAKAHGPLRRGHLLKRGGLRWGHSGNNRTFNGRIRKYWRVPTYVVLCWSLNI